METAADCVAASDPETPRRVKALTFSIIIPSYNEGNDVRLSIESALSQKYENKEIIVVDDSEDRTPAIIEEYLERGVKLLRGPGKGCCGARNAGMMRASGDVVVLLNADVVLPADFLDRLAIHYHAGADYVLVESRVLNDERPLARFLELQHRYESEKSGASVEWTEGFSCRRQAALAVGLIPGDFSIRFCRDVVLGKNLGAAGFRKVIDPSIVVTHRTTETFGEYWRVRQARGRFAILLQGCLWRYSVGFLLLKVCAKDFVRVVKVLSVLPSARTICRITRQSQEPLNDLSAVVYGYFSQMLAVTVGEWKGLAILVRRGSV